MITQSETGAGASIPKPGANDSSLGLMSVEELAPGPLAGLIGSTEGKSDDGGHRLHRPWASRASGPSPAVVRVTRARGPAAVVVPEAVVFRPC